MNSPRKNTKKSPKKGIKLRLKKEAGSPPKRTQTITSMFKKQTEDASCRSLTDTKKKDTRSIENEDVEVVKEESKYFGSNDFENTDSQTFPAKRTSSRLRLRTSLSTKIDGDESSKMDTVLSSTTDRKEGNINMTSSQKEIPGETETLVSPSGRLKRNLSLKRRKIGEKQITNGSKKFRHSLIDSDPESEVNVSESQIICDENSMANKTGHRNVENAEQSKITDQILKEESDLRIQVTTIEPITSCSSSSIAQCKEQIITKHESENLKTESSEIISSKVKQTKTGNKRLSKADNKRSEIDHEEMSISFHDEDSHDSEIMVDDSDVKPSLTKEVSEMSVNNIDFDLGELEREGYRIPYYLENFRTIMTTVLEDEDNRNLFNEEDKTFVSTFDNLSGMLLTYTCNQCLEVIIYFQQNEIQEHMYIYMY